MRAFSQEGLEVPLYVGGGCRGRPPRLEVVQIVVRIKASAGAGPLEHENPEPPGRRSRRTGTAPRQTRTTNGGSRRKNWTTTGPPAYRAIIVHQTIESRGMHPPVQQPATEGQDEHVPDQLIADRHVDRDTLLPKRLRIGVATAHGRLVCGAEMLAVDDVAQTADRHAQDQARPQMSRRRGIERLRRQQ